MMPLHPKELLADQTRRHFLRDGWLGLGGLALTSLMGSGSARAEEPFLPRPPHFAAKAKSVIYLHLGSPPHLDLFDYKPELVKRDGQPLPRNRCTKGKRSPSPPARPSCWARRGSSPSYGKAGVWLSRCRAAPGRSRRRALL